MQLNGPDQDTDQQHLEADVTLASYLICYYSHLSLGAEVKTLHRHLSIKIFRVNDMHFHLVHFSRIFMMKLVPVWL